MLPDDDRMLEEMVAVKYKHLTGGIIQIESKDDIRKRLGRSTDTADSVIQAFWVDGLPSNAGSDPIAYSREGVSPATGSVGWSGYSALTVADMADQPGGIHAPATVGQFAGMDWSEL